MNHNLITHSGFFFWREPLYHAITPSLLFFTETAVIDSD